MLWPRRKAIFNRQVQFRSGSEHFIVRHVLITGAGGFVGSRLARRVLNDDRYSGVEVTLLDRMLPSPPPTHARAVVGDIADPAIRRTAIGDGVDLVFHLAGILGGAAEANYPLSRRVNIDATLSLLEEISNEDAPARFVFASSIAVYGAPLPPIIDDNVWPHPTMHYGAQKLMIEVALDQFSRRGKVDGLAIRLPGIVARKDADARQRAAFLNLIFHAFARGEDFTLPVSPEGTTWLLSVPACIEAFLHAGAIPTGRIGDQRAFNLPAQNVRVAALIDALRARFPRSPSRITYAPDRALIAQFTSQPPQVAQVGQALGFRHDGDLATLVANAFVDD